ncbi:4254_t:CDS:2, partial [Racocetra persica]
YILLRDPNRINLVPSGSSYSILNASNTNPDSNNLFPDITVSQSIDVNSVTDNYFSHFWKSVESVFFWINGRWDQLDQWDFIPLDILAILASILLVMIMQNMLIAFMTNAFEEAQSTSEVAVLRHRAGLIADFETLEKPFGMTREDRRYIYYIGKVNYQEDWLEKAENYRSTHHALLGEEIVEEASDEDSDDDSQKEKVSEEMKTPLKVETGTKPSDDLQKRVQGIEGKIEEILELLKKK